MRVLFSLKTCVKLVFLLHSFSHSTNLLKIYPHSLISMCTAMPLSGSSLCILLLRCPLVAQNRMAREHQTCHFIRWGFVRLIQMSSTPGESSNWLMKTDKNLQQRSQLLQPPATFISLSGLSLMLFSHIHLFMTNKSCQEVNSQ